MSEIIFKREQLYKEIWKEPIRTVCLRYAISDNKLREVCKQMNIPMPDNKYWGNLKVGNKVAIPKLPQETDMEEYSIWITKSESLKPNVEEKLLYFDDKRRKEILKICSNIKIAKILSNPHKIIKEIMDSFGNKNDYNYYSRNTTYLALNTENTINRNRILMFCDTLFKTIEKLGYIVENDKYTFCFYIERHKVQIRIKEKYRLEIIKEEKQSWVGNRTEKRDKISTGSFEFIIESYYYAQKRNWQETEKKKLEDMLGDIVVELIYTATKMKKVKEEEATERKRQEELQNEYERRLEIQKQELARVEELKRKANNYSQAKIIREFLKEFSKKDNISQEEKEWVEWAKNKADWLDPLVNKADEILDEEIEPPNSRWW